MELILVLSYFFPDMVPGSWPDWSFFEPIDYPSGPEHFCSIAVDDFAPWNFSVHEPLRLVGQVETCRLRAKGYLPYFTLREVFLLSVSVADRLVLSLPTCTCSMSRVWGLSCSRPLSLFAKKGGGANFVLIHSMSGASCGLFCCIDCLYSIKCPLFNLWVILAI